MDTTEDIISTGCPATAPQPIKQVIKPVKFQAQPQEWKIISSRECPIPENIPHSFQIATTLARADSQSGLRLFSAKQVTDVLSLYL